MKRSEEWGIDLKHIKRWMFWQERLTTKLILLNVLVIAIVIWLAGVSLKDLACLVVGRYELVGEGNSGFFNATMEVYLWRASILALLSAVIIHYVIIRNMLFPLKQLTKSTRLMIEGQYPELVPVSNDEIGQLTRDFNELAKTLQRTEENRKRLLGDIAHELRTPLSNLNGYLEALSCEILEGSPQLYQSLLEESQYLTSLVEQIHELTVWESKKYSGRVLQEVSIHDLLLQSLQSFQLESKKRSISLEISIQDEMIIGEEDGIKQVLNNLLQNAFMYSTGKEIRIEGRCEQFGYRLTVSNQGRVIPEEARSLIFERFYRVDLSRHREESQTGTGLGLAIVKEVMNSFGGQAGLDSNEDLHHFWVLFPLAK